jgi:hypothetical protein
VKERRVGAVEPSHIGEGRVRVDVSFVSFLCAKEKSDREVFFAPKKRMNKQSFLLYQRKAIQPHDSQ